MMASYKRKLKTLSVSSTDPEDDDEDDFGSTGFYGSRKRIKTNEDDLPSRLSITSDASSISRTSSTGTDNEASPPSMSPQGFSNNSFQLDEHATDDFNHEPSMVYISKAQKMMMSMGYKEGKGLGKHQQGIVDPIVASQQRGKRGFGFIIQGLEPMENLTWDKSKEHLTVEEEIFWITQTNLGPPSLKILSKWSKEGPKIKKINDQTEFCHPRVLKEVLSYKSVFDELSEKEMYKARSRCNPYETIGKLFFQNRAALKMANIDSVFGFMFTKPVDENGHSLIAPDELLYFADVCAAPGGFTEYVLWRRKDLSNGFCDAKGFGFTLKSNDFKLYDFLAASPEFFEPHYGVSGSTGDGDIYVPDNITNFCKFVVKSTGGKGVHFMMADGGFSVEGQENIQEILSKQIYLCQFLVALGIIRVGGHFVCKLFDIFTPFSIGLIYIMYRCFKLVSIHKPNTSRPANSERYIICKWKLEDTQECFEYLYEINLRINGFTSDENMDVTDLVSLKILKGDQSFYDYICEVNNDFGGRQAISLQKIRAFCQDLTLHEVQQENIRTESLKLWQLPNRSRMAPVRMDAKEKANSLMSPDLIEQLSKCPENLTLQNMATKIRSSYDFRFVILASHQDGSQNRGFFLSLGRSNIYHWTGQANRKWSKCQTKFELPPDTIVYGEIIIEFRGELKAQRKVNVFHIIDGIFLNGYDVSNLHVVERHKFVKKFAIAVNKESRFDFAPIRYKNLYKLEELELILRPPLLCRKLMKSGPMAMRVCCESGLNEDDPARYILPTGILLLHQTKFPWMMARSKSNNRKYWFNTQNRQSSFECLKEAVAPMSASYSNGAFWWWEPGVQVLADDRAKPSCLHLEILLRHILDSK